MATGLSGALQWAAAKAGVQAAGDIPSGPYGFIFACLVQYYFAVPPSSKMFLYGGWWLTDKVGVDGRGTAVRWYGRTSVTPPLQLHSCASAACA